jgi:arylsulfatase A-like enzyme
MVEGSEMITRRKFIELTAAASVAPGTVSAQQLARASLPIESHTSIDDSGWRERQLKRKPNILMVVLDDVGFGDLGCYGAEHKTPCADQITRSGTRFNNFHVTALCSPTRACLLTGLNAHAVGVSNIAEWGRPDLPGYKGWIRQDANTIAEMLKTEGYTTSATGKWHLSSLDDHNGTGPFDHWPTGRGFDHWYGFHGSAVDHWHPEMFENNAATYPNKDDNYHLSSDLADRAIDYIQDHLASSPDQPFFHYLAFGACHFPLHAPADLVGTYRGQYDKGWEEVRAQRFANQKKLGIVPADATLPPLNDNVPEWLSLSSDQRRFAARSQEVYAAFMEHTDKQLQRVVNFLKSENQYDDTIILLMSDNGAPGAGPIEGRLDVRRDAYLGGEPFADKLPNIDLMGSDASYCGYSRGWAQVSNTPLKWYKADTYEGGIRTLLIMSWPNGQLPKNEIRSQYHHVIDVVPTLLNMINMPVPETIRGAEPLPIQGTSFAYVFDNADKPTTKKVQYFETLGDRAIWSNGWKAVSRHKTGDRFEDDVWDLFHADVDFSEVNNLAKQEPQRLAQLKELWEIEAIRYDVLPLEDDAVKLYKAITPAPRATYATNSGLRCGENQHAPISRVYKPPYKFSGNLKRVVVDVDLPVA